MFCSSNTSDCIRPLIFDLAHLRVKICTYNSLFQFGDLFWRFPKRMGIGIPWKSHKHLTLQGYHSYPTPPFSSSKHTWSNKKQNKKKEPPQNLLSHTFNANSTTRRLVRFSCRKGFRPKKEHSGKKNKILQAHSIVLRGDLLYSFFSPIARWLWEGVSEDLLGIDGLWNIVWRHDFVVWNIRSITTRCVCWVTFSCWRSAVERVVVVFFIYERAVMSNLFIVCVCELETRKIYGEWGVS